MAFPDYKERLPKEEGKIIIDSGKRLGESEHMKDTYWSGYEHNGKYYITLNDDNETVWEASYDVMEKHCL